MIGMVLVTHGRLAVELRSAMEHVVGAQRNVDTVCIGPDDDMENRRAEIEACIERCDTGDGVVLLTDMFGGTPSNLAISMMEQQNVEVIAGVNLPMLVKLAKVRSQPAAGRRRDLRRGRRPQIHRRRLARAARLQAQRNAADDGGRRRRFSAVRDRHPRPARRS